LIETKNEGASHSHHRKRRRGFVAFCPEIDISSRGDTIEEARSNLQEALDLFFESASMTEIKNRYKVHEKSESIHKMMHSFKDF
jgi:predicted RNase H-like HicB family nuclease